MATITYSDSLRANLSGLQANPAKIQQFMLTLVEQLTEGQVIPIDATNPAVLCLESAAVMSANVITDNETKLRRQYPSMANSKEELYHHMADVDYLNVFSTPAMSSISFMLDKDEVMQKAVGDTSIRGTKLLTIPKYTKVKIADTDLYLLYPIDIRVMPHGGFNVTIDTSEIHPLNRVDSNSVDYFVEAEKDKQYLHVTVPMTQVSIERHVANVNVSTGFTKTYPIKDKFAFIRAFIPKGNGWEEIHITHSDLVYNKDIPTVVFKVLNNGVKITIPQVYINNKLITDSVRLDIYTTKGELDITLTNYTMKAYTFDWNPLTGNGLNEFSAPLATLNTVGVYSTGNIIGGSNGKDFERLKNDVTARNAIYAGLPISEKQLEANVFSMGYNLVKNIDHITDRQYLATKHLPPPNNNFIIASLGVTIGTLETSLIKLKTLESVTTSTYRYTLTPSTLYKLDKGVLSVLSSNETNQLRTRAVNDIHSLVNELNRVELLYTPFYYVFDIRNNEIVNRIYHMDNPQIKSRYFFQDNPTVGIRLSADNYSLTNLANKRGYRLEVSLDIGSEVRRLGKSHVNVQLSYLDRNNSNRFYIEGKLVSLIDRKTGNPVNDEYIYAFDIETRYDIDSEDGLILTPYRAPINLTHEFDIVTIINDYNPDYQIEKSDIDTIINKETLIDYDSNKEYHGVSQHRLTIEFGKRLEHLWSRTRTFVDPGEIEVYEANIPARYTEDKYQLNASGQIAVTYDAKNNNVKAVKLHSKGDLILTPTGEQVYLHRKGEPKLDDKGNPIYKDGGDGLIREIDIFLMDAKYIFAETLDAINYRDHCINLITQWTTTEMKYIFYQLLDRSEIFFHPSITIGNVKGIADNNLEVTIDSKQSLKITCFLSELDMQNHSLRDSIGKSITQLVQHVLQRKIVSKDAILQVLRQELGNTVKAFIISGLFKDKFNTVTLDNDTLGLNLGTLSYVLPNMQIGLRDDIEVEFLIHDTE